MSRRRNKVASPVSTKPWASPRLFLPMKRLCNLCPRRCDTNRDTPDGVKRSLCRASWTPKLALVSLHPWEEPCISGKHGAGTVFFSHCNLRCCFCQNYEISDLGRGIAVSQKRLAQIFLEQQQRGASCLELVTPTHYALDVAEALKQARAQGLTLPVAYNTNAYDLPETLRLFSGLVDIFMPDIKYFDSSLAKRYSGVPEYFPVASRAIQTMYELVGPVQFSASGLMQKGLIIRHLVLPWHWEDSIRCLDWIYSTFGNKVCVSIMNQYMPLHKASRHPEINRPLTTLEYEKVLRHAREIGITNAFIQVGKTNLEKFIPIFDGSHVLPRSSDEGKALGN